MGKVPKTKRVETPMLRERAISSGSASLDDIALVALLLGTGTSSLSVEELAARVLEEHGGVVGLGRATIAGLMQSKGIGLARASRIAGAIELGRRALTRPLSKSEPLRSSRDVDRAFRLGIGAAESERFVAVALDAKHRPTREILVHQGGRMSCPVEPASVFRELLRANAVAALFVHNHPSGRPEPSPEDDILTERLAHAGALIGIPVLDHIIVAREGYFSFLDAGRLEEIESLIDSKPHKDRGKE